jgi:hypothetical protein
MQLAVLRRARFGRSSEKLDHAIEQLELLIGELEADTGAVEARRRSRRQTGPRATGQATGTHTAGPQAAAATLAARDHNP